MKGLGLPEERKPESSGPARIGNKDQACGVWFGLRPWMFQPNWRFPDSAAKLADLLPDGFQTESHKRCDAVDCLQGAIRELERGLAPLSPLEKQEATLPPPNIAAVGFGTYLKTRGGGSPDNPTREYRPTGRIQFGGECGYILPTPYTQYLHFYGYDVDPGYMDGLGINYPPGSLEDHVPGRTRFWCHGREASKHELGAGCLQARKFRGRNWGEEGKRGGGRRGGEEGRRGGGRRGGEEGRRGGEEGRGLG